MVEFLKIQYRLKAINETHLDYLIEKGTIIKADKVYIMS